MHRIIVISILLCLGFTTAHSQLNEISEKERIISISKEMMIEAGLCALITADSKGKINVRTMQPFPPEDDMVVWFGTNNMSRKVIDIKTNPDVALYYASPDANGYVVLNGKAYLISDPEMKERYWMDSWESFYKSDRSNYLLIKFVPEAIEVLNTKLGIIGDTITWKVPSISLK